MGLILTQVVAFNLVACGPYSFSSSSASHLKTVDVPVFQDQTSEFGIKEKLTDEVIAQVTRDNTLRVTDRRNADSVIEGKVIRVEDQAGAFNTSESVQDIKVFITVSVKYEDLKKRKLMWQDEFTEWGTYNPNEGTQSRENAIEEAVRKIATDILDKSVSGW